MIVYVLVLEDRHIDVDVELFKKETEAVERAKEISTDYLHPREEICDGTIFHIRLNCEGDCVSVMTRELEL